MDLRLFGLLLVVGAVAVVVAAAEPRRRGDWWAAAAVVVGATALGRLFGLSFAGTAVSAFGELAALALVRAEATPEARAATRIWALAVLPGIAAIVAGLVLVDFGRVRPAAPWSDVAVGLLVLGFALKLALIPLYFWLAPVARAASAVSLILVVVVVDTGVVADLAELGEAAPWIFADHVVLWRTLAAATLIGGALLALAETDLKTILAFTGPVDTALVLLAVLAPDDETRRGVAVGLTGHALAVTALFGAVAVGETSLGRPLSITDVRGLAGRLPVASAVFMVGGAALLGLPPSLGFSAHWRFFRAALEVGGPVLVGIVFVAVALMLLTLVRALHRVWLGPAGSEDGAAAPVAVRAVLIAVAIVVVATGLVPRAFEPTAEPRSIALVTGEVR